MPQAQHQCKGNPSVQAPPLQALPNQEAPQEQKDQGMTELRGHRGLRRDAQKGHHRDGQQRRDR